MKRHRNARRHDEASCNISARKLRHGRPIAGATWLCDACGASAPANARGWVDFADTGLRACSDACARRLLNNIAEEPRPRTRADCIGGPRPCPWVSCRWHLYLDVDDATGLIRLAFPELEPWELEHTCLLDLTDRGSMAPVAIGEAVNLTRERVRMLLMSAMHKAGRRLGSKKKAAWEDIQAACGAEEREESNEGHDEAEDE